MALPKSIGIKLYDGSFVPIINENEIKSKKAILTTVRDNQKKAIIELYEGTSDKCINNEYLGKLTIPINRQTKKGEPGIEVHLRLDESGILYAKAWDAESGEESEIKIEHSSKKKILPETLSDLEITQMDQGDTKKIDNYTNGGSSVLLTDYEKGGNFINVIKILVVVLIILILLTLISFSGYLFYNKVIKNMITNIKTKTTTTTVLKTTTTTIKSITTTTTIKEIKKKEIKGVRNLEGKKHYIKWGDNLWNICKKYYKDPWYYPSLAEVNNIKNPRLIYAGTYIIVPPKNSLKRWDFSK